MAKRIVMNWNELQFENVSLVLSGIFYAVLCVFSIVTGLIYMSGKKELNPLELPDDFVEKLSDPEKRKRFTVRMGLLTFIVGIVQGVTAYSILYGDTPVCYWIAVGFTIFSICSAGFKLKGKINPFPLMKLVIYAAILVVLLLPVTKATFI